MDIDVENLIGRRADQRWNRVSVGDLFERNAWARPDQPAIIAQPDAFSDPAFASLSYAQADALANRVANALSAGGARRGDRVLIYCSNSIEALVTMIGIAKAGLVAVPVNPMLADSVLTWVVELTEPVTAVVDAEFLGRAAPILEAGEVGIDCVIEIGGDAGTRTSFSQWVDASSSAEPEVTIHGDDIWSLVFTSGTTAMPKAAMNSHIYSYFSAYSYAMSLTRGINYEDELVTITHLPIIFHCGHNSVPFAAFIAGGTLVLGRRPDSRAIAEGITRHRVTSAWLGSPSWVDEVVEAALADPEHLDMTSLRVAMFSWGAMRPKMGSRLRQACGDEVRMLEVFGQTESMSCFRFWADREPEKFAESVHGTNHVGRPTPILAADIHDVDGSSLRGRPGVPGEAVYRSPAISAGYYRNEEDTREALRNGWFRSGDSCVFTPDGSQVMVDRYKDIIKSGGENVSSIRVEGVLSEHPAVDRVAVIGLPDQRWGEAVTAVIVLREDMDAGAEEILTFARAELGRHEIPKQVIFRAQMPTTVGGKLMKFRLREELS